MAVIICEVHGRSGCYAVCPHIIEDKHNKRKPEKLITMSFYFGDFAGNPECPMTYRLNYCSKCVELYDFPKENYQFSEENLTEEELGEKFDSVGEKFGLICSYCFEDFMNEHQIFLS